MAWGFSKTASGMMFDVPLWVEIHNTKSTKQIIRNLNLSLYKHDMHVGNLFTLQMVQDGILIVLIWLKR